MAKGLTRNRSTFEPSLGNVPRRVGVGLPLNSSLVSARQAVKAERASVSSQGGSSGGGGGGKDK